jgi:hypothetical protein
MEYKDVQIPLWSIANGDSKTEFRTEKRAIRPEERQYERVIVELGRSKVFEDLYRMTPYGHRAHE